MRKRSQLALGVALAAALLGPVAPAGAAGPWSWPTPGNLKVWLAMVLPWNSPTQLDCGSHIDPNGRCQAGVAASSGCDRGSQIDPDGRCVTGAAALRAAVQSDCDRGSMIDPNGRCVTGAAAAPGAGRHLHPNL